MDLRSEAKKMAKQAKEVSRLLARLSTDTKNKALFEMADDLEKNQAFLIEENKKDLSAGEQAHLSSAMMDRLRMTPAVIQAMAKGLREVSRLPDPVGEIVKMWRRPNGLTVGRMRIPIGVIGIIYESRPNVTADAAGLCLKAGNAVILRGGSEAIHSNKAIVNVLRDIAKREGLHEGAVTFIDIPDRQAVMEMLRLEGIVDLIIPRGGEALIRAVTENSRIPVLKHYKGVCHVFVDKDADLIMADTLIM